MYLSATFSSIWKHIVADRNAKKRDIEKYILAWIKFSGYYSIDSIMFDTLA